MENRDTATSAWSVVVPLCKYFGPAAPVVDRLKGTCSCAQWHKIENMYRSASVGSHFLLGQMDCSVATTAEQPCIHAIFRGRWVRSGQEDKAVAGNPIKMWHIFRSKFLFFPSAFIAAIVEYDVFIDGVGRQQHSIINDDDDDDNNMSFYFS